jgi:hypothetical protein
LNLDADLLCFDTTSTYFETEDEDPDEDGKTAFRSAGTPRTTGRTCRKRSSIADNDPANRF